MGDNQSGWAVLLEADQVMNAGALASTDMVDGLIARYRNDLQRIDQVVEMTSGDVFKSVAMHFFEGNADEGHGRSTLSSAAKQLFERPGAVAHLNAAYWSQAMALTDVYDAMPQKRREEWNAMIRRPLGEKKHREQGQWVTPPIPEFEEQTVRSTLQGLIMSRSKFFAERVDGIFQALSRTHVTNCPEGFSRRMILTGITSMWGGTERVGYINDLRTVIAKFMGRDEPKWNATGGVVGSAKAQRGQWLSVDGGAMRIRCYLNGNAHLEVHPDIAWRLNVVLAQLHPAAIPSQFRTKPKKASREWTVLQRPLPFAVVDCLESLEEAKAFEDAEPCRANGWEKYRRVSIRHAVQFRFGYTPASAALSEARQVLEGLGGVEISKPKAGTYWQFGYDPTEVLAEVRASGCLPDVKSHQFYPTPEGLARRAVAMAEIGPDDVCLEPSAGMGGLAEFMPKDRTLCVELNPLHCEVLKAKGHEVENGDFLSWTGARRHYDRVVMNPPFSEGRWQHHVELALGMVAAGGVLVAILPSGARNKLPAPSGWAFAWGDVLDNQFPGVSVSVVILKASRAPS